MEALEELMGDAHIIKGKRTKRQRLQSPIPFSIATYDSPGEDKENANCSPDLAESGTTEEDEEDMVANCLILLAQGGSADTKSSKSRNYHGPETANGFRYTSKRFLEAPSTGSGKVGMYVYQCKTCDRTFPSFQALGGHRASHKRPKLAPVEVKRKTILLTDDDEGGEEVEEGEIKDHASPSLSLQLVNRPNGTPKSSPKVHECSICGAEFVSGQALGGHMRRHRISGGANTTLSLSPLSPIGCEYEDREAKKQRNVLSMGPLSPIRFESEDWEAKKQINVLSLNHLSATGGESEDQEAKKQRIVLSLDLDLNLPAPLEDQMGESKFAFASKEQHQQPPPPPPQQAPLVLSTGPALVDCQY